MVPVCWPHDGHIKSKESGRTTAQLYKAAGLRMLDSHVTFPGGGFDTEAGVALMAQRLESGKLKVGRHLTEWFDEYRMYHRDENGKLAKINDDLMSATRILCVGIRNAKTPEGDPRFGSRGGPGGHGPQRTPRFARGSAGHEDGEYNIWNPGRPRKTGSDWPF